MKLPIEFENRMRELLRDDFPAFLSAMDTENVRALRVNTLKYKTELIENEEELCCQKLSFCDEGYIFNYDHIGSHPLHHSGAIYVQEPAAMAAVASVEIKPGMKILDLCAAPGGKSTQAAALLLGEGIIVSNEIDRKRCSILAQNIERMGIRNAVVTNASSAEIGETYNDEFDLVIVDAPCSGEGMMRKNPLAVSEWSTDNIRMCAERQSEILGNVAHTVKDGGRLLYSTCTFAPEENEMLLSSFLSENPDFHLIPVKDAVSASTADGLSQYGEEMKLCRRFYPHVSMGEGQFIALLQRDCPFIPTEKPEKKKDKKEKSQKPDPNLSVVRDFLAEVLTEDGLLETEKYEIKCFDDGNYYLSPKIAMPRSIKCPGVAIGTVQKGRLVPHHNFFSAYGEFFKRKIVLAKGDERVEKYLHGESINTDCANGFAAVFYCTASMGGAKVTSGEAKNYYPKGLRK